MKSIFLNKKISRRVESGHPWIFGNEVNTGKALDAAAKPGEIVIAPIRPVRNKITGCIGIFYGEGQLLDCGNIFGKVWEEDLPLLEALGDAIWRNGAQELTFEHI